MLKLGSSLRIETTTIIYKINNKTHKNLIFSPIWVGPKIYTV